jgi:hypothetical protein
MTIKNPVQNDQYKMTRKALGGIQLLEKPWAKSKLLEKPWAKSKQLEMYWSEFQTIRKALVQIPTKI